MKKKQTILLIALLAVALLAPLPAMAWSSVRTGQKNFERAWLAYTFRRFDQASQHFAQAADAFAAGLAETPPSRTTLFASNLTMAGMSLYYAGRYAEVATPMKRVMDREKRVWEAPLYAALAAARLGDKSSTIALLDAYLKTSPGQPILSAEVSRQLDALESGQPPLTQVAQAIEEAAFAQFDGNINRLSDRRESTSQSCDGNYWWRNNRQPCLKRFKYTS
ncbi:hypothetical protein GKC30_13585 [Pseudodesulfovibrio sp. F-1]|uniref:Tetratricopeptide repeat protein n=1 Tax=Pseudodesulfovibrio alkaliphilus TaxID=2661613 RepID=A0A7K1KRG1_9BACT|nr:hypothetical protein [Pseudodesulfovibrio alkaliphilus]MUM78667.1 hypothetical protein [Pseudodesulfovibrio alkaliphilus]